MATVGVKELTGIFEYIPPEIFSYDWEDIKKAVKQKSSRYWMFDSAKDFLKNLNPQLLCAEDADSPWTKQEKHKFFTTFQDYPNKELVVSLFNKIYESEKERTGVYSKPKNLEQSLRKIDQVKNFLKAYPYDDKEFADIIMKATITNVLEKDNVKLLDNICSAMHNGLDKNTLRSYVLDSSKEDYIDKYSQARKIDNKNSTTYLGVAGALAMGMTSIDDNFIGEVVDSVGKTIKTMSDYLPYSIGGGIASFYTANPIIGTGFVVIAGLSIAKALQKGFAVISEKSNERKIFLKKPEELNKVAYKSAISNLIITPIIKRNEYDVSDKDNQQHLLINSFLIEKVKKPNLKLEDIDAQFKIDLNLTDKQVERINKLTEQQIHEIALIKNPQIRDLFCKNDMGEYAEIFKIIDITKQIVGFESYDNGKPFEDMMPKNTGINQGFIDKLNDACGKDRLRIELIKSYLSLYKEDYSDISKCAKNFILNSLEDESINTENFLDIIKKDINEKYEMLKKEAPEGGFKGFIKKSKGQLADVNNDVKKSLQDIATKYSLSNLSEVQNYYKFSKIEKAGNIISSVKDMLPDFVKEAPGEVSSFVMDNISKLRNKVLYTTPPKKNNSYTS